MEKDIFINIYDEKNYIVEDCGTFYTANENNEIISTAPTWKQAADTATKNGFIFY